MTENTNNEPTGQEEEPQVINYLDLDGVANLKNELDTRYITRDDVQALVEGAVSNYKNAIVQIVADKASVTNPEEGYLYLVPDSDPANANVYEAWAWEITDDTTTPPTYGWVKMGASQIKMEVDPNLDPASSNPVQNSVVTSNLALKLNTADILDNVVQGNDNPVKSSGIYSALAEKIDRGAFHAITAAEITSVFDGTYTPGSSGSGTSS
jgi:hypothetical protein